MVRRKDVKTRLALIFLVVAAACSRGGEGPQTVRTEPPASEPERAHDFTLKTFDGETFTLSEHFGELPVVLNFWAPW